MSVRIRSSPAVNRAAQEWFTGYFNTPVTLTGTFGEGAIGWRSLGTLSHAPVGGSCQVNLGRSGTQWTTRKHDSPQRKVILGLMSTPHSSFPHLQCCMRTFFCQQQDITGFVSLRSQCTKWASAFDTRDQWWRLGSPLVFIDIPVTYNAFTSAACLFELTRCGQLCHSAI